jgi:hypothetical protein
MEWFASISAMAVGKPRAVDSSGLIMHFSLNLTECIVAFLAAPSCRPQHREAANVPQPYLHQDHFLTLLGGWSSRTTPGLLHVCRPGYPVASVKWVLAGSTQGSHTRRPGRAWQLQ